MWHLMTLVSIRGWDEQLKALTWWGQQERFNFVHLIVHLSFVSFLCALSKATRSLGFYAIIRKMHKDCIFYVNDWYFTLYNAYLSTENISILHICINTKQICIMQTSRKSHILLYIYYTDTSHTKRAPHHSAELSFSCVRTRISSRMIRFLQENSLFWLGKIVFYLGKFPLFLTKIPNFALLISCFSRENSNF